MEAAPDTVVPVVIGPRDHYRAQEAEAGDRAGGLERRVAGVARLRMISFFVMVGPFLLLETTSTERWPILLVLGSAGLCVFLVLLGHHRRLKRNLSRASLQVVLNREAQARLDRRWDDLPPAPVPTAPDDHPSAGDLDLVGRASLSHLVGRVCAAPGKALFRQMVLDPLAPLPATSSELIRSLRPEPPETTATPTDGWREALSERQEAVRSLSEQCAFREQFELFSREIEGGGTLSDTERFLKWLEQPRWLANRRGLVLFARTLGIFTPLTLGTWQLGWTPGVLPVLGGLGAIWLHRIVGAAAAVRFGSAEAGEGELVGWSALLGMVERTPSGGPALERIRGSAQNPVPGAKKAIRLLARITDTASVRSSSLLHFPLAALFAWDVHVLDWLERWHAKHAVVASGWIRSLGELEALCALAGLAYDHPDWSFAAFSDEPKAGIHGMELGHPLLEQDGCVRNDVRLPGPGGLLLVTGSNMAGKTTLLRAIGVNQALALAGGAVAARGFYTRPILPWTAMRVRDSLDEGVSYFLAELHRLKRVVDAAQSGPTLYLLDEILQGTNSEERKIAARMVLEQLMDTEAIGAITTHDLSLASSDSLDQGATQVHFREKVREIGDRRELHFDYKLRPGPATSRNALLLLEIVGLGRPAQGS